MMCSRRRLTGERVGQIASCAVSSWACLGANASCGPLPTPNNRPPCLSSAHVVHAQRVRDAISGEWWAKDGPGIAHCRSD